jgi:membrane protein YdbS with pleckstrin-like domain
MVRTEREMVGVYGPVILTTQPAPQGFIYKYLLGLTPIILVGLSLIALMLLHDLVNGFPPSLVNSLQTVVPDLPQLIEICVVLLAPVTIFLFFIWLGDAIHRPEIWIGAGLTLLLSLIGALVMVQGMDLPTLSTGYLLTLFQWVAYLVQPFSVVAAVVVIAGADAFRRTLHYTLTRDAILITGGIWNQVENVIPLHQIERIGLVQSRLGHLLHFGTVVPAGKVFGLSEIDMTGHHEQGDMQHPDTDQVTTVRWQKESHDPFVCLYGILNPGDVKARIEKAMQKISEKDE